MKLTKKNRQGANNMQIHFCLSLLTAWLLLPGNELDNYISLAAAKNDASCRSLHFSQQVFFVRLLKWQKRLVLMKYRVGWSDVRGLK
jgi:hypothetical protein